MSEKEAPYFLFSTQEDLQRAVGNIDSYDGIRSATASRRSYLDIEPNISVRPEFTKDDYYRFRPSEDPSGSNKASMAMCMKAYEKVGIIKNVIDLMGDFASQGITLCHENKSIERFYRKWWDRISGIERSERFLNTLYRCGNVIIYRTYGKVSPAVKREMSKGSVLPIENPPVVRKQIPFRYDFLNPLTIEVDGGIAAAFAGKKSYKMKVTPAVKKALTRKESQSLLAALPDYIRKGVSDSGNSVPLDPERIEVFHYKKDDWVLWANPMINPILDDIIMLEKMKLADMSALDGAISNIRLWRLGDLEHKILPNKGAIDKLRNILASNVGGGTMDLVWGPEIDFKESNTQIYKFLGTEKYQPVLNSIYAGLGIPPTLTGLAGQSGGYTNNFISLKTLIDRLEYGRALLQTFWQTEIEYIQRSMGFDKPATIHFDHMLLSDETAEKNLLIRMVEEDIISIETVRERLGENNDIEEKRIQQERKRRDRGSIPPKASPYHNANTDSEYKKIALQRGTISIEDVTDLKERPVPETGTPSSGPTNTKKNVPDPNGGRPKFTKDTEPRKKREVKPKTSTKNAAAILVWSQEAQKSISEILNPALLSSFTRQSLRELNRSELTQLEEIKFRVLCSLEPFEEISPPRLLEILEAGANISTEQATVKAEILSDFFNKNHRTPNLDEARHINAVSYAFSFS